MEHIVHTIKLTHLLADIINVIKKRTFLVFGIFGKVYYQHQQSFEHHSQSPWHIALRINKRRGRGEEERIGEAREERRGRGRERRIILSRKGKAK
jgi:hypothetical protein